MHVCVCLSEIIYSMCVQVPTGAEEGIKLLGTGVTDHCEAQYGGKKLNPGSFKSKEYS